MIEVTNLLKKYSADKIALKGVTFSINPGEICGYIGTNGAGKSTTVKILTGVVDFDGGEVRIGGIDIKKDTQEVKRISGYVPENANLFAPLSVTEYLLFIGTAYGLNEDLIRHRTNNFAELFDFTELTNEPIANISKGNKQKVLITSALLHDPKVIYFDEPLNGLDAASILTFQELVSELARNGKTILYCSHLLDTIEKISSKIILLDRGEIRINMPTEELKKTPDFISLESTFRDLTPKKKGVKYADIYS